MKIVAMPSWKNVSNAEKEFLKAHGIKARVDIPSRSSEELIRGLKDADGVIVGIERIDATVIEMCSRLRVIAKQGIGVDNIDLDAATQHGIMVINVPHIFAEPVANFTVLLMLALTRNLLKADQAMRAGAWDERRRLTGIGLRDKTLGVIGLGNIGSLVAKKCWESFGMRVLTYDPYITEEKALKVGAIRVKTLDELLTKADIVTLHVPLTKETYHMIGKREIRLMKETAFLINTSRGAVVDEDALVQALKEGRIAGAAIDVYSEEPPDPNHPLFGLENAIVTPHIASSVVEANQKVRRAVLENVCRILEGEMPKPPTNLVNKNVLTRLRTF